MILFVYLFMIIIADVLKCYLFISIINHFVILHSYYYKGIPLCPLGGVQFIYLFWKNILIYFCIQYKNK